MTLALDIPNPVDVVGDLIGDTVGWAWEKVAEGIVKWVLGAVAYFVEGVVNFLLTSARPNVGAAWFSGPDSPYATVRNVAVALLLGFVFLGIIQGLFAGDIGGMIRRVAVDLPTAILGMIATTVIVDKLLQLTDALSAAVLTHSGDQAVHFLSGFGVTITSATQGFAAVMVGLVAIVAGFFVWVELIVRSVLVYILVALSPLTFAAMVWPSARGVLRRTVELLLAVILSKLVICIALSVGVAALAGAGNAGGPDAGVGDGAAASMGTLFVGTAILAMAAFAPFLILKLIPWAEAALVAQGVSRSPVRAAHSTMGTAYYANSLGRLAGSGTRSTPALAAGGNSAGGWEVGAPIEGSASGAGASGVASGAAGTGGAAAAAGAAAGGAVAAGAALGSQAAGAAQRSADAVTGGGGTHPAVGDASQREADSAPRRGARPNTPTSGSGFDAPAPEDG